jgi:hypothetical protein
VSTADESDSTEPELEPEVHEVRSPRRSIDPGETAFEDWMVDANSSNTTAYGHLGSLVNDATEPKTTGVIARFRTHVLREWLDLVELLGASTVDLQFALSQNARTDPMLIGNPAGDIPDNLDLVAAAAPVKSNSDDSLGRVEFTTGQDLDRIKKNMATNHMVEVEIGSEVAEIELLDATGDGGFELVDDMKIPQSELADSQEERTTRLNFSSDDSAEVDAGMSSDSQDEAVVRIPGVESEHGDSAEDLIEQVVAGALEEHEIGYDGTVSASVRRECSSAAEGEDDG